MIDKGGYRYINADEQQAYTLKERGKKRKQGDIKREQKRKKYVRKRQIYGNIKA